METRITKYLEGKIDNSRTFVMSVIEEIEESIPKTAEEIAQVESYKMCQKFSDKGELKNIVSIPKKMESGSSNDRQSRARRISSNDFN